MSIHSQSNHTLGILAGLGDLPYIAARNAIKAGEKVVLFCFTNQKVPKDLQPFSQAIVLTKLYSSFFRAMKKEKVDRLLLLGKATRDILFKKPKFDLRTILLLFRMSSQSDYNIFDTIATEIGKLGIEILPQTTYLHNLRLSIGRYGPKFNKREFKDCLFGIEHATMLNEFDIGQTVVVGKLSVLALEAAEGTDQCIRRGGKLFQNKGAIVCKLPKKDHDPRFDIPAIGLETIESMKESGCRILVFDHNGSIVIDPIQVLQEAKQAGITMISLDMQNLDMPVHLKEVCKKSSTYEQKS